MSKQFYRRSNDAIFSAVGEDVVALHIPRGHCYGMENVTAAIWNLLEEPSDIDAICAHLIEHYDVEPSRCQIEVAALLDQLRREGLVEVNA